MKYIIDIEPTDDFLDTPLPTYEPDGRSLIQAFAADGHDVTDLGTLAAQMEARGHRLGELPATRPDDPK